VVLSGYLGLAGLRFLVDPRGFSFPRLSLVFSFASGFAVAVVYLTLLWTLSGRTYGYLVMGLRVSGQGGRRLRFVGAATRAVCVVALPIGIAWGAPQPRQPVTPGPGPRHPRRVRLAAPRRPQRSARLTSDRGQFTWSRQSSGTAPAGPGVGWSAGWL
jgi:uncharacterized RDD family membrane protein YckC